jgi:hypothetical protein
VFFIFHDNFEALGIKVQRSLFLDKRYRQTFDFSALSEPWKTSFTALGSG